jgi:hypothetical protein
MSCQIEVNLELCFGLIKRIICNEAGAGAGAARSRSHRNAIERLQKSYHAVSKLTKVPIFLTFVLLQNSSLLIKKRGGVGAAF